MSRRQHRHGQASGVPHGADRRDQARQPHKIPSGEDSHLSPVPLRPRPWLFAGLLGVFVLWVIFLLILYFTTVRH